MVAIKTEPPDYEQTPPDEFMDVYDQPQVDKSMALHLTNNNNDTGGLCPKPDGCEHRCTKCATKFSNRDSVLRHLLIGCIKAREQPNS